MSLASKVTALASRVAAEFKAVRGEMTAGTGWATYTPVVVGFATSTPTFYYKVDRGVCRVVGRDVLTSVTSIGLTTISFPVPAAAFVTPGAPIAGAVLFANAGASTYPGYAAYVDTTHAYVLVETASTPAVSQGVASASYPFAFGSGDSFAVDISYPI